MKTVGAFLLTLATVGLAAPGAPDTDPLAPLLAADSPTAIDHEYIVIFKEDTTSDLIETHKKFVRQMLNTSSSDIEYEYDIGEDFHGYAALMKDEEINKVRKMPEVDYAERSQILKANADCTLQKDATWGIVRTSLRDWIVESTDYNYYLDPGNGVDVYVIDTGIYTGHEEFSGGRAVWGYDSVSNPSPKNDGNGHGTHVAGTVVGNKYGVAKRATAIAVRVLNDNGSGTTAGVIAGVNWVANQHSSGKKSVANMSLGGGASTSLDSAVNAAVDKGVHFAVAAGNENSNACSYSPARAAKCVTVGATDRSDQRSYFSNYGTCVDIFAPGSEITAAWNDGGYRTISGTSMASPHVAGVMAKLLGKSSYTPTSMKAKLIEIATNNKITNVGPGSPNKLLFNDCA